jgi:anti-sigma28 factor (negative regulator of flagellin synthesis)
LLAKVDMDIRRIGNVPGDLKQPDKKQGVSSSSKASPGDRIEISDSARAAQEASELSRLASAEPDVRPERVAEVRQALADGALLSSDAVRRLAERLADIL